MSDARQQRLGERNGRASLTDAQVEEVRTLREEELIVPGRPRHWTYQRLAQRFGVSRRAIGMICTYRRRTGIPETW